MSIGDILSTLGPKDLYYRKVLEEIKKLSEVRKLEFVFQARGVWELDSFVRPGKRTFFGIKDEKNERAILGMVLVPDPSREHSDQAWNRIELPSEKNF